MTKEQAIEEVNKAFEPAFANYIITALTEGATVSDKALEQRPSNEDVQRVVDYLLKPKSKPTSNDCVSRQAVDHLCFEYLKPNTDDNIAFYEHFCDLPPVKPTHCIAAVRFSKDDLREICNERIEVECTHGTCKECKHWKDSDGVYRRGISAESKCPINNSRVFDGTFCCADFEKRGNKE